MSEFEPGESYYLAHGWSGCAGSAWRTLPPAAKEGWEHAERNHSALCEAMQAHAREIAELTEDGQP